MRYLLVIILCLPFCANAQNNPGYLADLDALYGHLKKTPSFKDQVKGPALKDYHELYERLKKDTVSDPGSYHYFYQLAQLLFPIRDNHLGFYQSMSENNLKDRPSYEKYIASPEFKNFPKASLDIDSLNIALSAKPRDSVEGIYWLDTLFSVGVFKSAGAEYTAVVLSSKVTVWQHPNWEKGQVAFHLYEFLPGHFKAIYADPVTKRWILFPNEKFRNASLINSHFYGYFYERAYSKMTGQQDFSRLPRDRPDYELKMISPGIQYLQLKHFSADEKAMQQSEAFYDSIKNLLTEPNLVVDLRNNQGGAMKVSAKFLKLLKRYAKTGRIFVLVNNGTYSQGEIFTLQLRQSANAFILGQTTNGTLMYGSNYGRTTVLPSNAFRLYLTDMDGDSRLLPYEVFGVQPDIELDNSQDWIAQTIAFIRKK
ncbi:MAG: hypothetical protein JWQ27_360 [Ferruginibacter sp.]|nr:hypothetical protein [Ferruginibacter sp.]